LRAKRTRHHKKNRPKNGLIFFMMLEGKKRSELTHGLSQAFPAFSHGLSQTAGQKLGLPHATYATGNHRQKTPVGGWRHEIG
jgi:hypothetical protein